MEPLGSVEPRLKTSGLALISNNNKNILLYFILELLQQQHSTCCQHVNESARQTIDGLKFPNDWECLQAQSKSSFLCSKRVPHTVQVIF